MDLDFDWFGEQHNIKVVPFFRFADSVGDGTGTKNAVGDVSSSTWKLTCPAGKKYYIVRMIWFVEDGGPFSADNFAGLGSALSNGIDIYKANSSNTKLTDITDPDDPIVSNMTMSHYCYDVNSINFGAGNDGVAARWTFLKSGMPLILSAGEKIIVDFNDDLTGVIRQFYQFQGVSVDSVASST